MAPTPPSIVTIDHDPTALAAILDDVAARGHGWVNVVPELPEGTEVPATPNALAVFNKRGPVVPLGTWTPPRTVRRGVHPAELGVQQGTARRATEVLAGTPGEVPAAWSVWSDHPRRGTVVVPTPDTPTSEHARWLLDALVVLCIPPRTGRFLVATYEG